MRTILYFSFLLIFLLSSCVDQPPDEKHLDPQQQKEIVKTLENIATDYLKSWEPPYDPDGALSFFTQSDDFYLVSDGHETDEYADWAYLVPKWMAHDAREYQSYAHEIKNIETVVLSPKSGVVTAVYIWDSISKEGEHARIHGAITLTCRKENGVWKIVHYHGSHYEPGGESD